MIHHRFFALIIAISAAGLIATGCSKKGPAGAASGESGAAGSSAEGTAGTAEALPEGGVAGSQDLAGTIPTVYFDYNQASVRADAREPLKKAAEQLKGKTVQITIEGHCDERGSSEYNLALGERRAQSVKAYLRTLGVEGASLSTISYGKERPADSGHNEAAWAKNRRADLILNR
jgi:peptidoglycan-associated lipoprotein